MFRPQGQQRYSHNSWRKIIFTKKDFIYFMNNEEKIAYALDMLQALKWNRDSNWLSNAMRIDEVIRVLKSPSTGSPATGPGQKTAPRSQRAGLSDRLIALIGKPSGSARARKTQLTQEGKQK